MYEHHLDIFLTGFILFYVTVHTNSKSPETGLHCRQNNNVHYITNCVGKPKILNYLIFLIDFNHQYLELHFDADYSDYALSFCQDIVKILKIL